MAQPTFQFPEVWTERDLDVLPEDGHRYEILDGSLHVTPPPNARHQLIADTLRTLLQASAPSGWRVLTAVGVRVPGGNLVPDVAVLRPGADLSSTWQPAVSVALVVEVASTSTEVFDRGAKAIKYAQAGIPAYWRVARDGTVIVHRLAEDGEYETSATVAPGARLTAGFPFEVVLTPEDLIG